MMERIQTGMSSRIRNLVDYEEYMYAAMGPSVVLRTMEGGSFRNSGFVTPAVAPRITHSEALRATSALASGSSAGAVASGSRGGGVRSGAVVSGSSGVSAAAPARNQSGGGGRGSYLTLAPRPRVPVVDAGGISDSEVDDSDADSMFDAYMAQERMLREIQAQRQHPHVQHNEDAGKKESAKEVKKDEKEAKQEEEEELPPTFRWVQIKIV